MYVEIEIEGEKYELWNVRHVEVESGGLYVYFLRDIHLCGFIKDAKVLDFFVLSDLTMMDVENHFATLKLIK